MANHDVQRDARMLQRALNVRIVRLSKRNVLTDMMMHHKVVAGTVSMAGSTRATTI